MRLGLRDDDGLTDKLIDDAGHINRWPVGKDKGEAPYILRFAAEIDLFSQVRPNLLDEPMWLIMLEARHESYGEAHHPHQGAHIAIDLRLDAGTANFDDHVASVIEASGMDLRDRGGA
jgi:hypothetical protein